MKRMLALVLFELLSLSMFLSLVPKAISPPETFPCYVFAHCNIEGLNLAMPIILDGEPTGYYTPYQFTLSWDNHSLEVPTTDPSGHPFAIWVSGFSGPGENIITFPPGMVIAQAYYGAEDYTYSCTIEAHCDTEGVDVSVPITMDGYPTGYNTPQVFLGLTDSHNFTLPNTDSAGHTFTQWSTGETSTTISFEIDAWLDNGGTYTVYYQEASPGATIYIRADGSVDPPTAPIQRNGNVYTLTSNITSDADPAIVVERDNIVVDGSGFTVEGTGAILFRGIYLNGRSNVTIKNTAIEAFDCGIFLASSSNNIIGNNITANNYCGIWLYSPSSGNSISGNNITNNGVGILLDSSSNNIVSGNNIANNWHGIFLSRSSNNCIAQNNLTANDWFGMEIEASSSNNSITENTITDGSIGDARAAISLLSSSYCNVARNSLERNNKGLYFTYADDNTVVENEIVGNLEGFRITSCSNNFIIHNSFIENTKYFILNSTNLWNASYPSGGNYWSDYTGIDQKSGSYQNETGSDGIGDTPYLIDANNHDNFPLMKSYGIQHDIGVTNVATTKTIVGQGYSLNVSARIVNYGMNAETFNVTIYANDTFIEQQTVILTNGTSTALTFIWNTTGFARGNYTISAYAWPVSGENDTADNLYTDVLIQVAMPGDINADKIVNIIDIVRVALAFGAVPANPNWNPNANVNGDEVINIVDIVIVALHFGETG